MASNYNAADLAQYIARETTFAQTPTAGAKLYELPVKTDSAGMDYKYADIKSDTKRAHRAGNGKKKGMGTADASWALRYSDAEVFDVLLESALAGHFTNGKLVAGDQDSTFTHFATYKRSDTDAQGVVVADTANVERTPGCAANSVSIEGKMGAEVNATFSIIGADRFNDKNESTLAVTSVGSVDEFVGKDVTAVAINGIDLTYTSFNLNAQHANNARGALGTNAVRHYSKSGNREITLTLECYKDFALDALVKSGVTVNATLSIGHKKFTIPLADIDYPQVSVDAGDLMSKFVLTARFDETTKTDLIVERI